MENLNVHLSVYYRLVLHSTKRNSKKQKHFYCALRDQNFLLAITRYLSFTRTLSHVIKVVDFLNSFIRYILFLSDCLMYLL